MQRLSDVLNEDYEGNADEIWVYKNSSKENSIWSGEKANKKIL